MTFVLEGEILIDSSSGKAAVKGLGDEQTKLKTSTEQVTRAGSRWSRGLNVVRNRVAAAENGVTGWIAKMRQVDSTQKMTGASTANLVAQFNDVGVMMVAGQDPLQLAIQQGTQITQVFGNKGAAAAFQATRNALVAMVSPLNLITIGSIAAGAAMVQWLNSSSEEVESFEDRINDLSDAVEEFGKRQEAAFQSAADMMEQYGSASPALRTILQDLARLSKLDAERKLNEISASLRALVIAGNSATQMSRQFDARDFLGFGSANRRGRQTAAIFAQNLDILRNSEEPAKRLAAALDVREILLEASDGLDNLNKQQREFYDGLAVLIEQLETFSAKVKQPWEDLKATGQELWSSLTENAREYFDTRLEAETSARNTIEQLYIEAEIAAAIREEGEGSVEVAELRLKAERKVFAQRVKDLDISEALKNEMMSAWDAANGVASVDMAGNIELAADQAARLNRELLEAQGREIMDNIENNPDFFDPRGESRGAGQPEYVYQDMNLPPVDMPDNPGSGRRKGGGVNAIERERRAIANLLQKERERLEILEETDPVQQEMIRHRQTMASATDSERAALEELIAKRIEEQERIDETRELGAYLHSTMEDVAEALIAGGEDAANAWDRVKASLAAALLQATLLGTGPLAGAFGTSESGGLVGMLFGGTAQAKADGGMITGQGGDRSDKEVVLASPGEFFVNARATRQHRHLLEAINAGGDISALLPRAQFADGGVFGAPLAAPSGTSGTDQTGQTHLVITPSPMFNVAMEEVARNTSVEMVEEYDRTGVDAAIDRRVNDPRGTG